MIIEVKMPEYEPLKSIPCHQYMDVTYSETVPFIIALIKYFVKEKKREKLMRKENKDGSAK